MPSQDTRTSPGPAPSAHASPDALRAPAIYAVSATPNVARAGDTIVWNVRTTNDVATVNATTTGFTIPLQRQGPGRFGTSFAIPSEMPPFFRGTYRIGIEARTAAGLKATSFLSLRIE